MRANTTALIGNIQKFSTRDGPGIRSTVFLKGCPLRCEWCHNPEMIRPQNQMIISPSRCIGCGACVQACPHGAISVGDDGPQIDFACCAACGACSSVCYAKAITPVAKEMTVDEVMETVLQDRAFYADSGGGVTISGGEPLQHGDFVRELIDACGEEGIDVCIDTSGYGETALLLELASRPAVTHVLFDIKHMDTGVHERLTGAGNELILHNLRALAADPHAKAKIWIRMPLLGGVNDGETEILAVRDLLQELDIRRVSLLSYHEMGIAKALHTGMEHSKFEAPSAERMAEIRSLLQEAGVEAEL